MPSAAKLLGNFFFPISSFHLWQIGNRGHIHDANLAESKRHSGFERTRPRSAIRCASFQLPIPVPSIVQFRFSSRAGFESRIGADTRQPPRGQAPPQLTPSWPEAISNLIPQRVSPVKRKTQAVRDFHRAPACSGQGRRSALAPIRSGRAEQDRCRPYVPGEPASLNGQATDCPGSSADGQASGPVSPEGAFETQS